MQHILRDLSEGEIEMCRKMAVCGGVVVKTQWFRLRKEAGVTPIKKLPPFAEIYRYDPNYGTAGIPKRVLRCLRDNPGTSTFIAWPDEVWREIRAYFRGEIENEQVSAG